MEAGLIWYRTPMAMQSMYSAAPELAITRWFNTADNPTLADLRGEVVVLEAFQMLCPGCVSHGLPQAKRIQQAFGDDLTVLGPPLRIRTSRRHGPPVSLEASPARVPHHLPGRCRRPRSRYHPPHFDGPVPTAGHSEPCGHRPGRSHSASTHLARPMISMSGLYLARLIDRASPWTGGRLRSRHRLFCPHVEVSSLPDLTPASAPQVRRSQEPAHVFHVNHSCRSCDNHPCRSIGAPNDNQRSPPAPFIGIERGPSRPTALTPCSNPKAAPHRWIRA